MLLMMEVVVGVVEQVELVQLSTAAAPLGKYPQFFLFFYLCCCLSTTIHLIIVPPLPAAWPLFYVQ